MKKIVMQKLTKPWVVKIDKAWQKTVDAVIATGKVLLAARDDLPYGEFMRMVRNELPFGVRTAQRLMAIGGDKRLQKATRGSHFPAAWRTLYEITRLTDEQFHRAIDTGIIKPGMRRRDLEPLTRPNAVTVRTTTTTLKITSIGYVQPEPDPVTIEHDEPAQDVIDTLPHESEESDEAKDARAIVAALIERFGEEPVRAVAKAINWNRLVLDQILAAR